jgi:uncharacterized surface protein with fasciclin (FAS1) repeats
MAYQEGTSRDQTVSGDIDRKRATWDILDTLARDPGCRLLVETAQNGGLEGILRGPDPVTFLAPHPDRFDSSSLPANPEERALALRRHVLRGAFTLAELKNGRELKTYGDAPVRLEYANGELRVEGRRVVQSDIRCTNGVVHFIEDPIRS